MYESMIAGPAYNEAAEPVSTKIPAPMMAPIPRVTRFIGPSARFRLCSPVSPASFINVSSDLVANKGLPMQLLLWGFPRLPSFHGYFQFGSKHCRGAACCTPTTKFRYFAELALFARPDHRDHSR